MADIITSIVTGGTNNHATVSEEANAFATDFVAAGIVTGNFTNTGGVSPATGSFAINQSATPAMTVDISAGTAYISAIPTGQATQVLRAKMSANTTAYAITANVSGSTKYDWVYLVVDSAKAADPAVAADDVTSLYTSRSTSNSTDNGTPPTYKIPLAVITVTNGATSIVNANITDKRSLANITLAGAIDDASITGAKLVAKTVTPSKMLGVDMYGVTTALVGTAPAASTGQFYMQAGTSVVTLAAGSASINFPTAFPNGVLSVVVTQGDVSQTRQNAYVATNTTATHFHVYTLTTASGSCRINWVAIGF